MRCAASLEHAESLSSDMHAASEAGPALQPSAQPQVGTAHSTSRCEVIDKASSQHGAARSATTTTHSTGAPQVRFNGLILCLQLSTAGEACMCIHIPTQIYQPSNCHVLVHVTHTRAAACTGAAVLTAMLSLHQVNQCIQLPDHLFVCCW